MNPFTAAFRITPTFSKTLFLVLTVCALLTILVVIYLSTLFLIKLFIISGVLVWFYVTVREHCWHRGNAVQEALLRTDNIWLLSINNLKAIDQKTDQKPIKAELLSGCLVQPWLTILQFKIPNQRKKSLILLKDNIDPDTFRRLRVRLRNSDLNLSDKI